MCYMRYSSFSSAATVKKCFFLKKSVDLYSMMGINIDKISLLLLAHLILLYYKNLYLYTVR